MTAPPLGIGQSRARYGPESRNPLRNFVQKTP
jgi:hypothetical protein